MRPRPIRILSAAISAVSLLLAAPDGRPDGGIDAGTQGAPPSSSELQAAARALAAEHALSGAELGIAIVDVDSGRSLAAVNEHLPLNPASNAKLYTAGAALAILHGSHRYETTLSGKLEGSAVHGSLALRGYGDPSLTTADLWAMVQELKSYGVRTVDGDVVVDQRFFDEQTVPPAFDQQPAEWSGFRAPVSAVALDENCVTMTVRPPSGGGNTAHVEFAPPGFVDVDGAVAVGEPGTADNVILGLAGSGFRMTAHISGAIASDSRLVRYTRRADDPRLLAGYALKALLEKADVAVGGQVKLGTGSGRVLARHASEPLSTLLYALGKQSDNFFAEMIFKSLAGEAKSQPAKSADAGEILAEWAARVGVNDSGLSIKNGSGLFDANRVTAFSTTALLRWAWNDPDVQPEFVAQLSIGGVDGTLRKRFRGQSTRRRVRAKTGTLDDAIALSGYVTRQPPNGPVAFSILFNRVRGKEDAARRGADRLVELIAHALP